MYLYLIACVIIAFIVYRKFIAGARCTNNEKLEGKTVIVTGANTGIGKETAKDLAKRGAKVIIACRDIAKANEAATEIQSETGFIGNVKVMKLDLASLKSIRQFVEDFKKEEKHLHILINNAGVMFVPQSTTEDGFELTMGVNHLGHFLLTNLLLDTLKRSAPSRIVNVSSSMHRTGQIHVDDLNVKKRPYNKYWVYGDSKLANVVFTKELARRLEGTGVTAYSLHPGAVQTDLQRHMFPYPIIGPILTKLMQSWFLSAEAGAQTSIYCATEPSLHGVSGKYYTGCAETKPIWRAEEADVARQLWVESEKLVGLTPSN